MATVGDWVKSLDDANNSDEDSDDTDWVPPSEKVEVQHTETVEITPEEILVKEENERKRKANLWDSFLTGVKRPKIKDKTATDSELLNIPSTDQKERLSVRNSDDTPDAVIKEVKRVYDFAGEEVIVTEKVACNANNVEPETREACCDQTPKDSEDLSISPKDHNATGITKANKGGNLSSIVSCLGKKKKMGTLQKSALDWESFKSTHGTDLQEELESHRKGKNSFLDRKDFLERVDWKQFENERKVRQTERRKQNTSN